ncbi:hypothetical protein GOQ29_14050 [Clostridium sp. D2Q-14]|uniref:hypothetical protein n=1 Tax=Anaeromonas gelatinilytica TaxID=2683194 RepID=UPI00193C5609|nr:hypothetical protein [Anaeromonas gelatinilytica]MBS4536742.1 hypothetical protein [Anaeromonas gelatinilytica]
MNICVKYCGGCNVRYDRKSVIERLKEDYLDINIITRINNEMCHFVVILSGCMSSCIKHEELKGINGKMVIKDIEDYQKLKSKLDKMLIGGK